MSTSIKNTRDIQKSIRRTSDRSRNCVSRSPSKSRSRSSEKMLDTDHLTTPKFRVVTQSPSPCSPRRASAVNFSTTPPGTSRPSSHSRSRSLKVNRHSAHIPHSLSGSNLSVGSSSRSSINHSLSVPSGEEGEFHLIRNFSVTSKGVVNRGDSFRCKSRSTSLCSTPTSPGSEGSFPELVDTPTGSGGSGSACNSPAPEKPKEVPKYKVWMIGSSGVGKSAIRNQFMTSEYICQYDTWRDERENQSVVVSLDGEETELEILEYTSVNDKMREERDQPEAYVFVYSVSNRRSFLEARQAVSRLEHHLGHRAAILVGNKMDLARLRTVTTVEGRSLAKERGSKFVETSVAINHQLDELLVGVVSQIRIKARLAEKQRRRPTGTRSKATCVIKRLFRKTCRSSKSCDNLHAL